MFIFTLLLWAVFFVLSEVLRPKPKTENARPAHLGDFNFPTATEGRVVPLIWGTVKVDGPNVIWYGDLKKDAITKKVKTGLFSSSHVTTGYRYKVGIQFGICRGDVNELTKIWVGDKVLWTGSVTNAAIQIHKPNLFGGDQQGGGINGTFRFYSGSRTQLPNAYLAQEPSPYLWSDDFSKGTSGDPLSEFKKSEPNSYYQVSNRGTIGSATYSPGSASSSPVITGTGTGTLTHVRSSAAGGAPGDLSLYTGLLMHPDRPRLADNIKIHMTFRTKDPAATDFGSHEVWMGCRVQDTHTPSSGNGIYVVVQNQNSVSVFINTPTSGGQISIVTLTAPTDFPSLIDQHEVELHVAGAVLSLYVDGNLLWSGSDSRILDIPDDFQGFCIGIMGNLNLEFGSGNDWSAVGIYSFDIDSLLRSLTSDTPAYRGTCYGILERGYVGTSTQIDPWAFQVRRTPNVLSLTGGKHLVNGFDANPMNVIYEILTDPDWGLGQSSSDIDTDNFLACADTLYDEGNGWSINIDNPLEVSELITELERQIDGYLFVNRTTGKWQVTLARGGYTLSDLPSLTPANVIEVKDFTRGSWEETSNNVRVEFANRSNEYATTYALGQDSANIRLQGGSLINVEAKYPGVKDKALANQIAWRDLRAQSYPLVKAKLEVDRSFHATNPGDVLRWTDASLNITDLPIRVTRVDLGQLDAGAITLDVVQDVFTYELPSFSAPDNTQWLDPTIKPPANIELDQRLVFEAPYAFCAQADELPGTLDRVWVGARDPLDGSAGYDMVGREGSDVYSAVGDAQSYLVAGTLSGSIDIVPQATGTIDVAAEPDLLSDILDTLEVRSPRDIGRGLFNLLVIDDELLGFQGFVDNGSYITLTGVYRGLMDTVPAHHANGAKVWFLTGNVTDVSFIPGSTVDIKLITHNSNGDLDEGIASPSELVMSNRARKPLPPAKFKVSGNELEGSTTIDSYSQDGLSRIYMDDATPAGITALSDPDGGNYNIGQRFTPTAAGWCLGLRFFKGSTDSGTTHAGALWRSGDGALLAQAAAVSEPTLGWVTLFFDVPVLLTSGVEYSITYTTPAGHFTRGVNVNQFSRSFTGFTTPADGGCYEAAAFGFPDHHSFDTFYADPIFCVRTDLGEKGAGISFSRRDLRGADEVLALDGLSLLPDFPTVHTTRYSAQVTNDPDGTPAVLFTTAYNTGEASFLLSRAKLIRYAAAIPARLRVDILTRHTYGGVDFDATQNLNWSFDTSSPALQAAEALGNLGPSAASPTYTAASSGSFSLALDASLTSGATQVQVNSGSWTTVVAAGSTSGTFTAASGDTISIRHTQTGDLTKETLVVLTDVTAGAAVAYGVLVLG